MGKRLRSIVGREHDINILIDALDRLEEIRTLSTPEATLRSLALEGIRAIKYEKLDFWRQCFSLRMAVEWDENSHFFHAATNGRRRRNFIQCLEVGGVLHTSHGAKSAILHDFYCALLGSAPDTEWTFDLGELYPQLSVPGEELSAPFHADEIGEALFAMDGNASPGPDGFGPSFYKAFWHKLKTLLVQLFFAFHSGSLDLDGLNRAHLIVLPKKEGICTADNYRPISLQNCPMKLFAKVMANRVRQYISDIVDPDQTGFVHGRNIACRTKKDAVFGSKCSSRLFVYVWSVRV